MDPKCNIIKGEYLSLGRKKIPVICFGFIQPDPYHHTGTGKMIRIRVRNTACVTTVYNDVPCFTTVINDVPIVTTDYLNVYPYSLCIFIYLNFVPNFSLYSVV